MTGDIKPAGNPTFSYLEVDLFYRLLECIEVRGRKEEGSVCLLRDGKKGREGEQRREGEQGRDGEQRREGERRSEGGGEGKQGGGAKNDAGPPRLKHGDVASTRVIENYSSVSL